MEDKNSGSALEGVFEESSPTLSEGMELSAKGDVLPSEFSFDDDVFVGGERDKRLKKSGSERRERHYKHARVQRACEGDINLKRATEASG